jgi:hypothetical protein
MLQSFASWLSQTPASQIIQNVLSSVAMIDLRIFGLAGRRATMMQTADRYLPWPPSGNN